MPTRTQVLRLIDVGLGYQQAAERLGVHPGLAYMIGTGLPADGADALTDADRGRAGFVEGSTQHLAHPAIHAAPHEPTRNERVLEWVRSRARAAHERSR